MRKNEKDFFFAETAMLFVDERYKQGRLYKLV